MPKSSGKNSNRACSREIKAAEILLQMKTSRFPFADKQCGVCKTTTTLQWRRYPQLKGTKQHKHFLLCNVHGLQWGRKLRQDKRIHAAAGQVDRMPFPPGSSDGEHDRELPVAVR